ncbi:MAG: radical SAM family heme chaperone HemW [Alphaproteobacteria bacterium]|nr:radical SAM family heme chaperone HemW [Alphaproteobacteria bacterium]
MYQPQEIAVYIHWPFCKSKCPYCDFYKELAHNIDQDAVVAEYIDALRRYRQILPERTVKSIFFGGGTPSLITPQNVAKIIDEIARLWSLKNKAEISLEANPNTHYQTMFADLKNAGINRLSLGVQALDEADLRFLGRTHTLETARCCLKEIVEVFDNHSADLIYARPQQQYADWEKELAEICAYGLKHLSLYQLTIEENTVFARKNIQPLEENAAAEMYERTRDFLVARNYALYEVSNFAQTGFESAHNLTYWQGGDYIGIGKSAHGRFCLNGTHFAAEYPFEHTPLTPRERAEELVFMGLRLASGIDKARFKQICGLNLMQFINISKLQELQEAGLTAETPTHLFATRAGFLLLNQIVAELLI